MEPSAEEFEALLKQCREGDGAACEQVFTRIYGELRRMAGRYMRQERVGHTLQPTALVNEVLLRVLGGQKVHWQNRSHLLATMANQMRHILVDYARRRNAKKRDVTIELPNEGTPRFENLFAVHEALEELTARNPLRADIAVKRVFVGMTFAEIGKEIGLSEAAVKLEWDFTKAWLARMIGKKGKRG